MVIHTKYTGACGAPRAARHCWDYYCAATVDLPSTHARRARRLLQRYILHQRVIDVLVAPLVVDVQLVVEHGASRLGG